MIEKILIISLIVFAIHYTMLPGEVFGFIGDWFKKHLPAAFDNPLYACVICMAPWYGTLIYWLVWHGDIKECVIVVIAAMGLNAVINQLSPDK